MPRPRKAFGPVVGTVVAIAAWVAVAHSSGAGWVQALGALLTGFLLVGLVGPALAVRRARCSITASPADAVAGHPLEVTLAVTAPVAVRALDPPGPEVVTGRDHEHALQLLPSHRGVVAECVLLVASAAPFGLLWWTKRVTVALPRPLHVAPSVGPPDRVGLIDADTSGEGPRQVDSRVGEPRGVRVYRTGDLRSWVHWPATAHARTLMVREMEGPASEPMTVRAILPEDPDAADVVAGRALGTVAGLLAAGQQVVLVTAEPAGLVRRPVGGVLDAGRRLARALPQRAPKGLSR
jgi:uncharacterized protein (DUF58 family)